MPDTLMKLSEAQRRLTQFRKAQARWQAGQPRRCDTNEVGAIGECLACDAEQGVHCMKVVRNV